ncbi:sensor domain-containing phosphodiesterase [Antrihabitans cavernicola]|uniref:EAL domain-containing protein n=1 Tax=Antrihabitans cavernicola TaxID=2495913 RepID=A0A5A7S9H8_9NOCA|nr:EAL domain-containing protein [Spelaeibacter cavernicola]KAA0021909.1 EAL domain-containing protein [Spelaeibacter cavernicola]
MTPRDELVIARAQQARRQHQLVEHYLFDDAHERLDATAALTAKALGFPFAQINILDEFYLHTIARHRFGGLDTMPRDQTMCQFTIEMPNRILAVGDLQADPRFNHLEGVVEGVVRSYVGVALTGREGERVGTLCVFDSDVRTIDATQLEWITQFGVIVEDQLERVRRATERQIGDTVATASLSAGIENGEIVPWYQPVVDLDTGHTVAYEALARWIRPDNEVEDPRRFLPLAEDSDLVLDLDHAILRQALADLRTFRVARPDLRVNVNISTRHLEIDGGAAALHQIVRAAEIPPDAVNLELTETRSLYVGNQVIAAVAELRGHGFGVVLDDFGSGWSSLDRLLYLDITGFKIDQAVTAALGTPVADALARGLAVLANDLNLDTTIEGVTTQQQRELAKSFGCRAAQGYLWTHPIPASVIG